jgi:hypothetical protein
MFHNAAKAGKGFEKQLLLYLLLVPLQHVSISGQTLNATCLKGMY